MNKEGDQMIIHQMFMRHKNLWILQYEDNYFNHDLRNKHHKSSFFLRNQSLGGTK